MQLLFLSARKGLATPPTPCYANTLMANIKTVEGYFFKLYMTLHTYHKSYDMNSLSTFMEL